jgi:hypothetical protein
MHNYFLNLLRPYPARPTKPEPSSISVAGSGVASGPLPVGDPSAGVTVVEVKLDLLQRICTLNGFWNVLISKCQ